MNSRHTRRLTIALGLVLTIAAFVAPSANAKMQRIYSDRGVALVSVSPELSPNMAYSDRGVVPIYPDGTPVTIYSDHGIATIPPAQPEPTQISKVSTDNSSSFDWSKTGYIVSLTMVGLLLLGGGVLLAGRHNRRRRFAAA
jgi:di/tricarboxylate transporter